MSEPENGAAEPIDDCGSAPKTFYLIDGHSLAYQAFYALPPSFRTGAGEPTNAVYGFVSMLIKLLDHEPHYLAVVFDPKGETFRDKLYDEYKAQRDAMPDDLRQQIPRLFEVLEAFNIPAFAVQGFEADDTIGTLARQAVEQGLAPRIVSRDRDLLQLLDEQTRALLTRQGITDMDEWGVDRFRETYGIEPPQLVDVKAFMGDSSDNIPGVPSIGEKTALKLIRAFHSVDGVLEHLDQVGGRKRPQLIKEHADQLHLSRTLAAIRTDVPVELDLEACRWQGPDYDALVPLLHRLEFGSFLDRLDLPADVERTVQTSLLGKKSDDGVRLQWLKSADQLQALADALEEAYGAVTALRPVSLPARQGAGASQLPLAADELAAPLPWQAAQTDAHRGPLLWLDMHFDQGGSGQAPAIWGLGLPAGRLFLLRSGDQGAAGGALLDVLAPYLCAETVPLAGHGLKQLYVWLRHRGYRPQGLACDLRLMAYLLHPGEANYGLSRLASRYLEQELPSLRSLRGSGRSQQPWSEVDEEALARFISMRLEAMEALARALEAELTAQNLASLYHEVELPLAPLLGEMQHLGMAADPAVLERLGNEFGRRLAELESHIHEEAGHEFNVNSTQQLGQILFEEMKLPVIKRTKTGYSTAAEVLETLAAEHEAAIANYLLDYRTLSKLQSTYVEGLSGEIQAATGRIHTSLNQTVAATGRLSSSDPNLQNIPIRLAMGRRLRRVFVAPAGRCLLAADYSQIELRVLAHMSGDERLTDAFRRGEDIHVRTAAEVFGVAPDAVSAELRRRAKAVNFGIVYGISDFGLARNLEVDRDEAGEYIKAYLRRYPGVKEYMEDQKRQARDQGYVRTLFGRIRYLPELTSRSWHRRQFAERTAINTPIQGTAADIIKQAMLAVDRALAAAELEAWMVLQVHDELLFELPQDRLAPVAACVRREMEGAVTLDVPLRVDIKTGGSWYGMTPLPAGNEEGRDAGTA